MVNKHTNESYIHDCGETKIDSDKYTKSILNMGFETNEIIGFLDFYLFHAIGKPNKTTFGSKSLVDYGWTDSSSMLRLEGKLLKAADIGVFCILKANNISETLEQMNLKEKYVSNIQGL